MKNIPTKLLLESFLEALNNAGIVFKKRNSILKDTLVIFNKKHSEYISQTP
jgi:hypothetical protein